MLRTSPDFHSAWSKFLLNTININRGPTFYQYITNTTITKLIKIHHSSESIQSLSTNHIHHITNTEQNALRDVAGYILCKTVQDELKSATSHPHRQALLVFISEAAGFEMDGSETENWVNILNRGGLFKRHDF